MPKRDLYERFLSTARERRTACVKFQLILTIITDFRNQKAPCDNKFKAVEQWCILKHVTLWELSPLLSLGMDVLLPQQYSQPLSWRTTEECGLFPSTSPQNNKCGSRWPGDSLRIRHRLYPLRSFHIPNWAFTAARREVWFCNWSLPRSWTQRRMLFPLLSRIHSWNWSFAGEILESLWARMNTITPLARMATLAHRVELIDDHANDSNYHKLLGMGM